MEAWPRATASQRGHPPLTSTTGRPTVGRTTSPEDFRSLYGGVRDKLFARLPDETWVYPGHGDDTSLGVERPHLAEWEARGW